CRAADDGEVRAAQLGKGLARGRSEPSLADDEPHAEALDERPRETLHAGRCRGAHADRRIARRMRGAGLDLAHVGGRVYRGMTPHVEARASSLVEERDLVRVADA